MWYKVGAQPAFFVVDAGWPGPPGASAAPVGTRTSNRPLRSDDGREVDAVTIDEQLWEMCEDYLHSKGLELDDLVVAGRGPRLVRITVDRDGGVDVDQLAAASRALSRRLDEMDPFDGSYSLEVTSPGLERPLRRPRHFRKSIGRDIVVKTHADVAGARHHRGMLEDVGADHFVVRVDGVARRIAFGEVRSAQTRFEWKKQPKSARKSG